MVRYNVWPSGLALMLSGRLLGRPSSEPKEGVGQEDAEGDGRTAQAFVANPLWGRAAWCWSICGVIRRLRLLCWEWMDRRRGPTEPGGAASNSGGVPVASGPTVDDRGAAILCQAYDRAIRGAGEPSA